MRLRDGILLHLVFALTVAMPGRVSALDIKTYRNDEWKFAISAPSSWQVATPRSDQVRLRLVDPEGMISINVIAYRSSDLEKLHPRDTAQAWAENLDDLLKEARKLAPDVKVLESRITTLNNLPAHLWIKTHTYTSLGKAVILKGLAVRTNRKDIFYSISAGGVKEAFDANFRLLQGMISSFVSTAPF